MQAPSVGTTGPVVGIASPGAMGSALGARLRDGGARVVVALDGRSRRTAHFAADAGLEDVGSLATLVASSAVVLSVVPPEAAVDVAAEIAEAVDGASAIVADLNAVSPATARAIASLLGDAGIESVDGAISGPPPSAPGTTRIYLSGRQAGAVGTLPFDGVDTIVVGDDVGLASAVKMCTASVYKGRVALLAQALRTAHAYGVVEHVLGDLSETGFADRDQTGATLARASAKAWRYVAEMEEIAAAQSAAGLGPELFRAIAAVYGELAERAVATAPEDVRDDVALETVLDLLSARQADPQAPR
jgi:3-hydroxyisobutyrate dehydrogenase-like beta-hydroxyacid dehydrogenase